MAMNMKQFSQDIELKLDKVYKKGASNHFGFDDVAKTSQIDAS
jgi:hypothetical protein